MQSYAELNADLGDGQQYIEACTGRKFYLNNPDFRLAEIAHALSNQCRYTGHCRVFYSVAEHSCLVASIMGVMGWGDPHEGLLHDGTESVLADIAAPVKVLLPQYRELEHRLDAALRAQFELPPTITSECKRADWVALAIEARLLMPTGGRDWVYPDGVRCDADEAMIRIRGRQRNPWGFRVGRAPAEAKSLFLQVYDSTSHRVAE